jgi:hypothetical protein
VDIITDLMIMALPMWLIFGLKMSRSQKIGLCGVLGLGVVIIIFSFIRIIVTNTVGAQPEISWLALWSSIESSVAVIVACLASFKVLLSARRGTAYPSPVGAGYYGNVSSGRKQTGQRGSKMGTNKSSTSRVGHRDLTSATYDDEEMHDLGAKHGNPTITITGGRDARGKKYTDKPWDNDSESQEHIMTGDDIRVQTTWNIETESRMSHGG